MPGITRFTFSFLFLTQAYKIVEALPPIIQQSPNFTSEILNFDDYSSSELTNYPRKLTKREEALIRKVITDELQNKTILNAVSNVLSAYIQENDYPLNGPLVTPLNFNRKSLKQKYMLRKPPRTTTPDWDQSLEDFLAVTTTKKPTPTPPSSTSSPIPTTTSHSDAIVYSPEPEGSTTVESTSKKYVVLTLYAAPLTQPPPPQPYPYHPEITTPLPPPPTTTLPWYKTAPNLFDPQQVGPIVTDLVVANINNGLIPNFLWNQAVDFAKGDGPRVTGILLECIFLPPCPT